MAHVEKGLEEELKLARQMKENYCDQLGKETDIGNSANTLYQIGLIYRKRSPDKLSLIKSVGLLNAAIFRNPSNVSQIKADLSELCRHILEKANAENQKVDLIEKGQQVKASFTELRQEVNAFLKTEVPRIPSHAPRVMVQRLNEKKISAIQCIYRVIASQYKTIMAEISHYCENVMGKPPCEYAIVGMGSLAREEITPYSDFEHIILLGDDENWDCYLEYFRWFSVIFHIIILNVQESIIASLNVECLNGKDSSLGDWFYDAITPRGISFDGMMPHACKFPLGRQQHTKSKPFTTELIKPVSEMLKYLSSEADLKNGYHLADILTKTCFVYGNRNMFKQFVDSTHKYLDSRSEADTINDIQNQVKEDLNKFSARFRLRNLKSQKVINIKQLVYRSTTLFISALASKYNIQTNSCFEIIVQMAKHKKISQNIAEKLKCSIAIACEMRLRVYMKKESQCDNAINLTEDGIEKFLNIVGVASIVNYFQIAYCLQCEVAKQLNFTKMHFYANPQLINIAIALAFEIDDLVNFSENPQKHFWDTNMFDFDTCIEKLETKISLNYKRVDQKFSKLVLRCFHGCDTKTKYLFSPNECLIHDIAHYLFDMEIFDEALEFFSQLLEVFNSKLQVNHPNHEIAVIRTAIGMCLFQLDEPSQALQYHNKALEIKQRITVDAERDSCIGATLRAIGNCYFKLNHMDKATANLRKSLQIFEKTTISFPNKNEYLSALLCEISTCQETNSLYKLKILNRSLQILKSTSINPKKDRRIASTLYEIGHFYLAVENFKEALANLTRSLQIIENTSSLLKQDVGFGTILYEIGCCHHKLQNFNKALSSLKEALQIFENIKLNLETDRSICLTLLQIGHCYFDLKNYDKALPYLNRSLLIMQNTSFFSKKVIALTLYEISCCQIKLQNYSNALTYLKRSLEINQTEPMNPETERRIGVIFLEIGTCNYNLQNYNEALTNFRQSLQIFENGTLNAARDMRSIAQVLHQIGCCENYLQNYNEALKNLYRALQIEGSITLNREKDKSIAVTEYQIGVCHIYLQNYDKAFTNLYTSLRIFESITMNAKKDRNIGATLHEIGRCHKELQNYDVELSNLKKSFQIYENTSLSPEKDKIGMRLYEIGCCQFNLQYYNEALATLNRSLQMHKNAAAMNAETDRSIGLIIFEIGCCQHKLKKYNQAVASLNQSLQIFENTTLKAENDRNIGETLYVISCCQNKLKNYHEALKTLNRSLQIFKNTASNEERDSYIAATMYELGCSHNKLKNYNEALACLNRSLQVDENATSNTKDDKYIGATLCEIGCCHSNLQNYNEALTYLNRSLQIMQNIKIGPEKDEKLGVILDEIGRCHMHLDNRIPNT